MTSEQISNLNGFIGHFAPTTEAFCMAVISKDGQVNMNIQGNVMQFAFMIKSLDNACTHIMTTPQKPAEVKVEPPLTVVPNES